MTLLVGIIRAADRNGGEGHEVSGVRASTLTGDTDFGFPCKGKTKSEEDKREKKKGRKRVTLLEK